MGVDNGRKGHFLWFIIKLKFYNHFKMSWSSTALKKKMTIVNMIVKLYHFFLTIVMQNIEEKVTGMIVAYSSIESNSSVNLH